MRSVNPYTDNSLYHQQHRPTGLVNTSSSSSSSSSPPPPPPDSRTHFHPHIPTCNSSIPKRASSSSKRNKLPPALSATTTTTTTTTLASSASASSSSSGTAGLDTTLLSRASLAPPQPSPLQPRDPNQHVLSLTSTTRLASKIISSNMPPTERSRQPQLSAAAAKAMNRTPLTPKVAVMAPQVATPMRTKTPTVAIANTQTPSYNRDDPSAPAALYLSNNVTPRSGPRQSRVNSVTSTPSGTPNLDRTSDIWDSNGRGGLGMSPLAHNEGLTSRRSLGESSTDSKNDSKFFYASDARPIHQSAQPRPPSVQKNMPTFFYASDASAPTKRVTSPPAHPTTATSTLMLGPTHEGVATKFFYANGTPDVDPRPSLPSSGSGSTSSNGSKAARPSTSSSTAGFGTPMFSRPASPVKGASPPTTQPSLRASAMSPASPNRGSVYPSPMLAATTNPVSKRRVSIDAPPRVNKGHARTGSVPTESLTVPRFAVPMTHPPEPTSPPLSPGSAHPTITMASMLQMADELDEEDEDDEEKDEDSESESHSPRRSSQATDPISALVASARRERKVQDLQITNASLEAINRTLERQLRKQTAELRRYRRLSRSGWLAGHSAAPSRVTSVALSVPPVEASDANEEGSGAEEDEEEKEEEEEEEEKDDDEEEDEEDEEDFLDDESSSGEEHASDAQTPNPHDANSQSPNSKRRKRDERRLQLDLTKHQELLLDSQKMNQSLKRCLNWTEVLIKEGQKALAYHVKVSDIQFGGRVLAPTYYDYDDDDTSHPADDTVSNIESELVSNVESEVEPWIKGPQDRDSGIELPVDGG